MKRLKETDIQKVKRGADILVRTCARLKPDEKVLIISDDLTHDVGLALEQSAKEVSPFVQHVTIKPFRVHGQEPPEDVADQMLTKDVIFGATEMSMAHSLARYESSLTRARYLSLPDYSLSLLSSDSLLADFQKLTPTVQRLARRLAQGRTLSVTTDSGTDITIDIHGQKANAHPGWCSARGELASPPDIEANITPAQGQSNGTIVVDGSIPCREIGLLKEPLHVTIENGIIANISGTLSETLEKIFRQAGNARARTLAEVGFGLNPKAKLRGVMLEDEGCLGTVHFGFGSNMALGGNNKIPFHLDMVVKNPAVRMDGQIIIHEGAMARNNK